jgi:hypothetical protein
MGILQKYTENGSEYKSLKFGKDKPGGGSSNEPFMKKDINTAEPIQPGLLGFPSVLRGGIYSEALAATDVARLTKYFLTPDGIQFALNQNLLSRLAPRTEASGVLNEYIYTPLSTLAQAGVGNLGVHLNKQGLDPTGLTSYSIKKYGEVVYENNLDNPNTTVSNRLVDLHLMHIDVADENEPNVLTYTGGPGSIFGVGSTKIKFATKADGITPLRIMGSNGENPKIYLTPGSGSVGLSIYDSTYKDDIQQKTLASYSSQINQYLTRYDRQLTDNTTFDDNNQTIAASIYPQGYPYDPLGKYSSEITLRNDPNTPSSPGEKAAYLNKGNDKGQKGYLANLPKSVGYTTVGDALIYDAGFVAGMGRGIAPDFRGVSRKVRGFVDPSSVYDHITLPPSEVDKRGDYYKNEPEKPNNKILDRIYYTTSNKRQSTPFNPDGDDLIPFRIGILNQTTNPIDKENISFKAYIDNMSDSYDADWSAQTYMGRGEKLYKYNSFGRSISLGFTVAAEGPHNMKDMYDSLNKLASSLAPTYVGSEYMAGNIHKLTIGNYIHELYGIITGFTYDIDNESPWEIGNRYGKNSDKLPYYYNKQLPMFIKVTGFKFTPIHNFRPEYLGNHQFINMGSPEIPSISGQVKALDYDAIAGEEVKLFTTPTDPGITSLAGNTEPSNPVVFR